MTGSTESERQIEFERTAGVDLVFPPRQQSDVGIHIGPKRMSRSAAAPTSASVLTTCASMDLPCASSFTT